MLTSILQRYECTNPIPLPTNLNPSPLPNMLHCANTPLNILTKLGLSLYSSSICGFFGSPAFLRNFSAVAARFLRSASMGSAMSASSSSSSSESVASSSSSMSARSCCSVDVSYVFLIIRVCW